jgi:hypothetical protein
MPVTPTTEPCQEVQLHMPCQLPVSQTSEHACKSNYCAMPTKLPTINATEPCKQNQPSRPYPTRFTLQATPPLSLTSTKKTHPNTIYPTPIPGSPTASPSNVPQVESDQQSPITNITQALPVRPATKLHFCMVRHLRLYFCFSFFFASFHNFFSLFRRRCIK